MQRHNANGQAVAEYLAAHPRIERVYYPGLPGHPNYEIARRTMRGCGGVVTFTVKDADWRQTAGVVDALRLPQIAASLGGVESLVEQPLILSYYEFTPEQRQGLGHSRQHDPAVVRHREYGRFDRRLGAGRGGCLVANSSNNVRVAESMPVGWDWPARNQHYARPGPYAGFVPRCD